MQMMNLCLIYIKFGLDFKKQILNIVDFGKLNGLIMRPIITMIPMG